MLPFHHRKACDEMPGGISGRSMSSDGVGQAIIALIAIAALLLVGWVVARALGSPLLAVVASGMFFLTGVSLRGAGQSGRR